MGKGSKIIGILCLVLGIACFALYFVMGDKFSNYKVMFDSQGGTSVAEQIVENGGKANKPNNPTKDKYEFVEWQLDGVAYNFDNVVSKNMTLVAKWNEIIMRNIKVTLDGAEYVADVRDGEKLTVESLNIPPKDGYLIKLYNENDEEFNLDDVITGDLSLNAKYIEIKTYTVKFDSNGGSKVEEEKVEEGKFATEPTSIRDGYILDGWYLGEEKFNFQTPITKDITLKARWNDGPKVNVIFMVDGVVYKTVSIKENTTVSKITPPAKKGYKFVEWQLEGKPFDFKDKINEETTLTARYEEVTSYTVTFNTDGGSSVPSQTVTDKVTKPASPSKSGYKFVEWQLNGKTFDFNTTITEDIQLKAIWQEVVKYTVRFNNEDGTEITTQSVEEGGRATKPADPSKDNYRFVGWIYNNAIYNFETTVTKDMVLTARFERIAATPTPEPAAPDVNGQE